MKPLHLCHFFYLFLCILLLTACEAQIKQRDMLEQPRSDQVVVYGHVDVVINGEVQEWGYGWHGQKSCCLLILPPDKNDAFSYQLNEDGLFYWSLPPGDYLLLGFRFQQGTKSRVGRVGASFTVPEGVNAVYIGDITIQMVGGRYKTVVRSNPGKWTSAFLQKFPGRTGEVRTELIRLPDMLGNFDRIIGACSDHWVVDCSGDFKGVTPLSPKVVTRSFPETDNLTPRFSWKPAGDTGINYDLVIYEAATYSFGVTGKQLMKGRLVLYEENLSKPYYQLKTPLKKNTKYYWSVRFRDIEEDWVSVWSSYSHFGFYVFYMTSGYGEWFAFSTP